MDKCEAEMYAAEVDEKGLRAKHKSLAPELNERARRIWAAT